MNKRKISLLLVGVLLVVCVSIGISYAVWSLNLKQEGMNTISTGCFNVTFSGINDINLNGAYPITDEEGASLTPYEFTITNTCEDAATYQINLEILNDSTLTELGIIKELLQEKGSTGTPRLLTSNNIVDKTLDNASSSYKLETGLLYKNESKTFELRLWMDENAEAIDSVMNKILNSKITVVTSYKAPIDTTNMMIPMEHGSCGSVYLFTLCNKTYTQNQKYEDTLMKVVFEKEINPYENAVEVVDFSINKDRSILGYYVKSDEVNAFADESYTLYIQANGKIKVNQVGSYYFTLRSGQEIVSYGLVEGIENLDFSEVEDMSYMFAGYNGTSLMLDTLDTKGIKNMAGMFSGANNLVSLNIQNFDTSEVTDMSNMFSRASNLTSLNLSSFDTRNVTDMESMFYDTNHLTELNLSSFDTKNVTDMSNMFYEMSSITTLNLSNFDTSKVTNMNYMFAYSNNLATITYGPKFVYKNNTSVENMFESCPANKPADTSWEGVLS